MSGNVMAKINDFSGCIAFSEIGKALCKAGLERHHTPRPTARKIGRTGTATTFLYHGIVGCSN